MSKCMKVLWTLLVIGTTCVIAIIIPLFVRRGDVAVTDVWVHRVNSRGQVLQSWNIFGPHRVKPLSVPTWTSAEYDAGNTRIDVRFRSNMGDTASFRFDTQTMERETLVLGERVSTPPKTVHPGAECVHVHWIRMWAENITQKCWIVNTETGEEFECPSFDLNTARVRAAYMRFPPSKHVCQKFFRHRDFLLADSFLVDISLDTVCARCAGLGNAVIEGG